MEDDIYIDFADIEDGTYFIDDNCRQLEEILATDSEFEEYVVKRIRLEKESPKSRNPFDVQRSDGSHIVWFYEWEFNLLDSHEIVPYLEVQRRREQKIDSYIHLEIIEFFTCLIGLVAFIASLLSLFLETTPQMTFTSLPYILGVLMIGVLSLSITSMRKKRALEKIDIESARENPLFVDALSKLAGLEGSGIKDLNSYAKRFRRVESEIMDRV